MAGSVAFADGRGRFAPHAALLSLLGHVAVFGAAAVFLAAPAPPEPAMAYAVLFEMPPPAPAPAVPEAAPSVPDEPEPQLLPEPLPMAPVGREVPAPKPRSKPRPAARPAPPSPAPAPSAIAESAPAAEIATDVSPAPEAPAVPAPVASVPAAPAPVPVVTDARFRAPPTPPDYPRRAVELGQRGIAVLRALVQPDGSTSEIVLWRSSGFVLLDDAALGAVRRWRFEPARRGGDAILAWVEIPVRFELN